MILKSGSDRLREVDDTVVLYVLIYRGIRLSRGMINMYVLDENLHATINRCSNEPTTLFTIIDISQLFLCKQGEYCK